MAKRFNDLSETQLARFLDETYLQRKMSIPQIAQECDTYNNRIRRSLIKCGYAIRDKSQAQKIALASGRHKHPTKGIGHSEEAKIKISEKQSEVWRNLTDAEKEHRSTIGRNQWNSMSDSEKTEFKRKANDAVRLAAKQGSKLEHFLLKGLIDAGYSVDFHREHFVKNERLQIDLFLGKLGVAVEVDGPSHFLPIWGPDTLAKNQQADAQKDGLLLGMGFCVIRIQQKHSLSEKYKRDILQELLGRLETINKKFPSRAKRHITLGD
jgi:very-short-patch-repair endonuclease